MSTWTDITLHHPDPAKLAGQLSAAASVLGALRAALTPPARPEDVALLAAVRAHRDVAEAAVQRARVVLDWPTRPDLWELPEPPSPQTADARETATPLPEAPPVEQAAGEEPGADRPGADTTQTPAEGDSPSDEEEQLRQALAAALRERIRAALDEALHALSTDELRWLSTADPLAAAGLAVALTTARSTTENQGLDEEQEEERLVPPVSPESLPGDVRRVARALGAQHGWADAVSEAVAAGVWHQPSAALAGRTAAQQWDDAVAEHEGWIVALAEAMREVGGSRGTEGPPC